MGHKCGNIMVQLSTQSTDWKRTHRGNTELVSKLILCKNNVLLLCSKEGTT